jgi:outer membrane beta-barrel protein
MRNHRFTAILFTTLLTFVFLTTGPALAQEEVDNSDCAGLNYDMCWAKRRSIRVIQKRKYLKEGKWEITLNTGVIPNDDFWVYLPAGLAVTHFLSEDVGLEFEATYTHPIQTGLKDKLTEAGLTVNLPQWLQFRTTVNGLWSPVYGKVGFLSSRLYEYDMNLIFGAGLMGTRTTLDQEGKLSEFTPTFTAEVGAGFRFWINKSFALRIGYRHYFYAAEGGGFSRSAEFGLGVSYFTGGPE